VTVNSSWHGLAGLAAPKRPLSLTSSDARHGPGLRRLFGPNAGLRLITRSRPENLIIAPTGRSKTILYVVATLLPRAEVTVVIVPLIALRQELLRRCEQWGISFRRWLDGAVLGQLHAVPPLLFVGIDHTQKPEFEALLSSLYQHGRLDWLILEEAHLLLTASHYRGRLALIAQLRRYGCPFVCLTATLPPSAESELKGLLNFTMPEVLRASSDRPNLCYKVRELPACPPG
jgi:superfamily II DNA helicase RecQ